MKRSELEWMKAEAYERNRARRQMTDDEREKERKEARHMYYKTWKAKNPDYWKEYRKKRRAAEKENLTPKQRGRPKMAEETREQRRERFRRALPQEARMALEALSRMQDNPKNP